MADPSAPWNTVGESVRHARAASGMTVRELARRIGVSASHVSQVERGIGAFSVPALYAVARELGVPMSDLLGAEDAGLPVPDGGSSTGGDLRSAGVVQRAVDHPSITLSSGPRWSRLTPSSEPHSEFLEVVYGPGTAAPSEPTSHPGREYGLVIEGRLSVMVDGATAILGPGDSLVLDSDRPHRIWNETDTHARAVWFFRDRPPGDSIPHR